MFSDVLKSALERDIVGQPRAVSDLVRGVTRAISGLGPRDGPLCAYLLMGPSGTGKTLLVRSLTRFLHGSHNRIVVAECTDASGSDPWLSFVGQIAPLFAAPGGAVPGGAVPGRHAVLETPPMSVILIEYLERGRPEVARAVATALETGHLLLPEGRRGCLRNAFVFLTSTLAADEMLDRSGGIGFSPAEGDADETEHARLFKICVAAAKKAWGEDFLSRLDDLLCFHPLGVGELGLILERLVAGLNVRLADRGFRAELDESARAFLLERGSRETRTGANDLVRQFERHLEFPVADLAVSGRVPPSGSVLVRHDGGASHLHFTVRDPEPRTDGRVAVGWGGRARRAEG